MALSSIVEMPCHPPHGGMLRLDHPPHGGMLQSRPGSCIRLRSRRERQPGYVPIRRNASGPAAVPGLLQLTGFRGSENPGSSSSILPGS